MNDETVLKDGSYSWTCDLKKMMTMTMTKTLTKTLMKTLMKRLTKALRKALTNRLSINRGKLRILFNSLSIDVEN